MSAGINTSVNTSITLTRVRLGWAVLAVLGVGLQVIATEMTRPGYFKVPSLWLNFFGYFTILTNLSLTLWFIFAYNAARTGQRRWWGNRPEIKGALLVAGTVTILVYWTLLVDIPIPTVTGEIANFLLHLLVPLGLWVDWLIAGDAMPLSYGQALRAWLVFPIAFVIYTELRGPIAHWYPYFFLDPRVMGGAGPLLLAIIGMTLLFVVVASLIFWLYQKRGSVRIVPAAQAVGQPGAATRRARRR